MNHSEICKLINNRIAEKKLKIYPKRRKAYQQSKDYIFFNHTCSIYVKHSAEFVELNPDCFDELLRQVWRIDKQHKKFTKNTSLIESEDILDYIELLSENEGINQTENQHTIDDTILINELIGNLPKKQKNIIIGLFYDGLTEMEIAEKLNLTRSTVHYNKEKALNSLYQMLEEKDLDYDDFEL